MVRMVYSELKWEIPSNRLLKKGVQRERPSEGALPLWQGSGGVPQIQITPFSGRLLHGQERGRGMVERVFHHPAKVSLEWIENQIYKQHGLIWSSLKGYFQGE